MIQYTFNKLLKKSGLSYRGLAEEMEKRGIGVHYMTLFQLSKAKTHKDYNLCAETIERICAYFRCQPNDVMRYVKK